MSSWKPKCPSKKANLQDGRNISSAFMRSNDRCMCTMHGVMLMHHS
jgi:hypothetical protein